MKRFLSALNAYLWQELALTLAFTPWLRNRIIARAKRTPYRHLTRPDGTVYMERYWLFNAYPDELGIAPAPRSYWAWAPSVRLHRILQADSDQHPHDHPWTVARTILLQGAYIEHRLHLNEGPVEYHTKHYRFSGDTALLRHGEYHQITGVFSAGVWTLFITWRKVDTWGFWVDGRRVPYREYLGIASKEPQP